MLPLVLVAAVHAALAFRTAALSYEIPVAIGWMGMLLVYADRARTARPSRASLFTGWLIAAAALGFAAFWSADYQSPLRVTPLALGAGFLLLRHGFAFLRESSRELLLLALPIAVPPPIPIRPFLEPQTATLHATAALLGLLGHPAAIAADVLSVQGGAIRVISACSGINAMSQLAALALMIVCLFETTRLQKVAVFASAIAAGFIANCCRLALLTLVSQRDHAVFELWHGTTGELRFTALGLALASLAWWLLLRPRERERERLAG
jgi:exosortase/archaeosortase family protein